MFSAWLRRHGRNAAFTVLRASLFPFLFRELVQRRRVTIVTFHAPAADRAAVYFRALKSSYKVIGLADYLEARRNSQVHLLPPKSLIITLDDGHKNNSRLRPLLEELGIRVTISLCSGVVD